MGWQQFVMDLDALPAEPVERVLLDHGACSVTLSDAGDDPVLEPAPGETPLWRRTRITALFGADADIDAVVAALRSAFRSTNLPPHRVETLDDRDWEREWLRDLRPLRFGERLWVCPGDSQAPSDGVVVRLDPGLAFGTGTHATTALCLEWLERRRLDGRRVLDYGCGSGILAIAALRLGCREAVAMDIDPQALTATRDNAKRNGVADRLAVVDSDAGIEGRFDIVIANILSGPLSELAESLTARLSSGSELALSGILFDQVNKIQAAYGRWLALDAPEIRSQGGQTWALVSGRRLNT